MSAVVTPLDPTGGARRTATVMLLNVIASVVALSVLSGCGLVGGSKELVGYTLDPAPEVGDLSLPDVTAGDSDDSDGAAMSFRAEPGGVLLVFFGYTSCPDVCPLTMSEIDRALGKVKDPERVEVAMVAVDPTRDTPDVLSGYVHGFVPDGHALRTTDEGELRRVADRFGASYSVTTAADGTVQVAHTGSVFVVDETGTVRVVWPLGTTADGMASDITTVLRTSPT